LLFSKIRKSVVVLERLVELTMAVETNVAMLHRIKNALMESVVIIAVMV